jgi:large subunit ribosomal protein L20
MRVKGGVTQVRRRNRVLAKAKGYFGAKSKQYRSAIQQVMKSGNYAYRDRRQRRRNFRRLWIIRVNAGVRPLGLSYSQFIHGLKLAAIEIDRKMLSELAIHDPEAFGAVVALAKTALGL